MARQVEGPWYRASKDAWYATVGGRSVSLRVRGRENRQQAKTAWHMLMAGLPPHGDSQPAGRPTGGGGHTRNADNPPTNDELRIRELADAFLAAKDGTVGRATHYVYACQLNEVKAAFGNRKAADLDANTFGKWLHSLRLSVSSKRSIAGVTMTAFRWAELAGLLPSNPLRGFRKPPGVSRGAKAVIPDNTHRRLYAAASPTFKPVLTLLRETGARPSELARLTAADIDLNNGVAVLTDHKTAHTTGRPRIIMLTPEAVGVLRELTAKHPTGPLLRNQRSRPWDKDAIGHAMRRLCKAVGVKAVAYGYRHAFATQALSNGVPDATVAALLGHSSTAMLHKHYSHLTSQAQAMREALLRVRPTA